MENLIMLILAIAIGCGLLVLLYAPFHVLMTAIEKRHNWFQTEFPQFYEEDELY